MSTQPIQLLDRMFTTDRMREVFSDKRRLQGMLDFEAALARALVRLGIAQGTILPAIESHCDAALFPIEKLANEGALAGNVAIPLVKELTALVANVDGVAMRFVHWGATSQDTVDTGLVLQLRDAISLIDSDLANLAGALTRLVHAHKSTLLPGRTWLQHAAPVTFGLKAAGWLDAIRRHRERLQETRKRVLVIQFGGAVGTLAALEERGLDVAAALADELKLGLPDLSWHAQRDRLAEVATTLGLLVGSLGKIARDVSLLTQSEISEVSEPAAPGRGRSSTMPHKCNPVGSAVVLAAAIRVPALVSVMLTAMVQEHERGLGGWQAEWETLPEICLLTAGALAHLIQVLVRLEIREGRMAENLEVTRGLILSEAVAIALGKHVGRLPAHEIVEHACQRAVQEDKHLRDILMEDARVRTYLSAEDLVRLFDPRNYIGLAEKMADRVASARHEE